MCIYTYILYITLHNITYIYIYTYYLLYLFPGLDTQFQLSCWCCFIHWVGLKEVRYQREDRTPPNISSKLNVVRGSILDLGGIFSNHSLKGKPPQLCISRSDLHHENLPVISSVPISVEYVRHPWYQNDFFWYPPSNLSNVMLGTQMLNLLLSTNFYTLYLAES